MVMLTPEEFQKIAYPFPPPPTRQKYPAPKKEMGPKVGASENYKKIFLLKRVPAVYKIENKINGNVYIGRSRDVKHRLYEHLGQLQKKEHISLQMQYDFNLHGEDCFSFDVLEYAEDYKLPKKEISWINKYKNKCFYNSMMVKKKFITVRVPPACLKDVMKIIQNYRKK